MDNVLDGVHLRDLVCEVFEKCPCSSSMSI